MNQRRGNLLGRSLNARRWWLLASVLIIGPAVGLYRMSASPPAAESSVAATARMAADHATGCWSVPAIRKWAMSANHAKFNPKYFMHSMQNVRIEPADGRCQFAITLTSVDHSSEGAKVTWVQAGRFTDGDSIPSSVTLRLK
jgi:hypothetical protein